MKKLLLQPRLQLLFDLVPKGARLIDVGTDHGYLPVALLQAGNLEYAIASDISVEPLAHAKRTAQEFGIVNIDFRLCDGLNAVSSNEVDTIVIAGMGGDTIIAILSEASWTKNGVLLLLQPMTKVEMLRTWLADNGYTFVCERLVLDKGNLYPILMIQGGKHSHLTSYEAYGGVAMDGDPLQADYLDRQINRLQRSIYGLQKSSTGQAKAAEHEAILCALRKKRSTL